MGEGGKWEGSERRRKVGKKRDRGEGEGGKWEGNGRRRNVVREKEKEGSGKERGRGRREVWRREMVGVHVDTGGAICTLHLCSS